MLPCAHGCDKHSFSSLHKGHSPTGCSSVPLHSKIVAVPLKPRAQGTVQRLPTMTAPHAEVLLRAAAAAPDRELELVRGAAGTSGWQRRAAPGVQIAHAFGHAAAADSLTFSFARSAAVQFHQILQTVL